MRVLPVGEPREKEFLKDGTGSVVCSPELERAEETHSVGLEGSCRDFNQTMFTSN